MTAAAQDGAVAAAERRPTAWWHQGPTARDRRTRAATGGDPGPSTDGRRPLDRQLADALAVNRAELEADNIQLLGAVRALLKANRELEEQNRHLELMVDERDREIRRLDHIVYGVLRRR